MKERYARMQPPPGSRLSPLRTRVATIVGWAAATALLTGSAVLGVLARRAPRGALEGGALALFAVVTLAAPDLAEHARQRRELRKNATTDHRW
jgi:hypothetical protein